MFNPYPSPPPSPIATSIYTYSRAAEQAQELADQVATVSALTQRNAQVLAETNALLKEVRDLVKDVLSTANSFSLPKDETVPLDQKHNWERVQAIEANVARIAMTLGVQVVRPKNAPVFAFKPKVQSATSPPAATEKLWEDMTDDLESDEGKGAKDGAVKDRNDKDKGQEPWITVTRKKSKSKANDTGMNENTPR